MRWDRLTFTALGGIAAFLVGIALQLEDERSLFAPVFGMVGGIAALAMANHERLKLQVIAIRASALLSQACDAIFVSINPSIFWCVTIPCSTVSQEAFLSVTAA